MKKTIFTLALALFATTAQAEIAYDYNNSAHKADNACVAVLSIARDALFNDVLIKDSMVFVRIVDPTAEVVEFRNNITSVQNQYILKYEYSKQFNNHYNARKFIVQSRIDAQGAAYLAAELKKCL